MWIGVVTLFPEMFEAISRYGITSRAVTSGLVELGLWNPRSFTTDRHATVDDRPFGGGPGMLMKVEPLAAAIGAAKAGRHPRVVYLSPQGPPARHADIARLAALPELLLVAGRYEGIDERLVRTAIDEELAVGEFVVSGGELPAMMLIDAIIRLQPGALGDAESAQRESFVEGLLDYPQYTRPREVDGLMVPEVLLSGNHEAIRRWRLQQALGRTAERRPDLLAARGSSDEEQRLLAEYRAQRCDQGVGHEEDSHG